MGIITKPIPVALQRRAAELPCDGKKRYRVESKDGLSYSEARAAIIADGTVGTDNGRTILRKGVALRLAKLNRVYFAHAGEFVVNAIKVEQAKQADVVKQPTTCAPALPEELPVTINDEGVAGTEVVPPAPVAGQTLMPNLPLPVIDISEGEKRHICTATGESVGMLNRNKSGYRCVIDGQEARSRSSVKMADLISTALEGHDWLLKPAA